MNTFSYHLECPSWPEALPVPNSGSVEEYCSEIMDYLIPNLRVEMQETPQDPIHHAEGDVWTHTMMVMHSLVISPDYLALSILDKGVVFYAALLHDIAKPFTTRHLNGRISAPGHSQKGAVMARKALWWKHVPWQIRERICALIEVHQVPFFVFNNHQQTPTDYLVRKLSLDRNLHLLSILANADMTGRISNDQLQILQDIELFAEYTKDLGCFENPFPFPDCITKMAYLDSEGKRAPTIPVYHPHPDFQVTLLSGLPASGKTTWRSTLNDLPVVSYDDIRKSLGFKHGKNTGKIAHKAKDEMRQLLREKQSFVIDATHLSRQMRQKNIQLIKSYGGLVNILCFESYPELILSRNNSRDNSLKNNTLTHMLDHWEFPRNCDFHSLNVISTV